jgi:2-methylcitrate dehydratase
LDKSLDYIGSYAESLSYKDLPETTIKDVKYRLIDSIGCALNAYPYDPSPSIRGLCPKVDSTFSARIIGSLERTTPEMAAFANSTMLRTLDFNDVFKFKVPTHPSDGIASILALAEALHTDGKSLITGIVLSYEMHVPFVERNPLQKGWDESAIAATLGSALGSGKILNLNKEQFANAAAMAILPNITLKMRVVGNLSTYKEVYAGMAARQGLFAALMAQAGLTGPEETMMGSAGLEKMVVGGPIQWEPLGGGQTQFGIERTSIKRYPVTAQIQIFVKAALDIKKKVQLKDIKKLTIKTHEFGATFASSQEQKLPKNKETADHSSPAAVAIALIDGAIVPDSFIKQRYLDQEVVEILNKIDCVVDSGFNSEYPEKDNCCIQVETYSGEIIESHIVNIAGAVEEDKWTDKEIEQKFSKMVENVLTPAKSQNILDVIWDLEKLDDCAKLIDVLGV